MDPDFVMTGSNVRTDMGRRLLFTFSQNEVKEQNEDRKKPPGKGGG